MERRMDHHQDSSNISVPHWLIGYKLELSIFLQIMYADQLSSSPWSPQLVWNKYRILGLFVLTSHTKTH